MRKFSISYHIKGFLDVLEITQDIKLVLQLVSENTPVTL